MNWGKIHLRAILALFCVASATWSSAALAGDTKPGQGKVAIVRAGVLTKVADLRFGTVVPSAAAGTVTLSPAGVRTTTGGVVLGTVQLPQPAEFASLGTQGQAITISLGAPTINLTGPGANMQVSNFILQSQVTGTTYNLSTLGTLNATIGSATGIFRFPIGATLAVGANQAPGNYSGTFNLTVNFQ